MIIKKLLFSVTLSTLAVSMLSAAPSTGNARQGGFHSGTKDPIEVEPESTPRTRDVISTKREKAAQEEAADNAQQSAEEAEEKPNWLDRLFGGKSEEKRQEANERDEAEKEAKKAREKAKANKEFSKEEREVLEEWQRGNGGWKKSGKKLPPGLQKKVARGGELPPGWKKKLAVGERIPSEYESEIRNLPEEILKRLPKSPEGTEIVQLGDQVIRVVENTREVLDILGAGQNQRTD